MCQPHTVEWTAWSLARFSLYSSAKAPERHFLVYLCFDVTISCYYSAEICNFLDRVQCGVTDIDVLPERCWVRPDHHFFVFLCCSSGHTLMIQWRMHQRSSGCPLLSGQSVRCRLWRSNLSPLYCGLSATLKRSAFWRDWMCTLSPMSLKASSSIAEKEMEKSVGASTHTCLTSFVIANVSEMCPPSTKLTIIPAWKFYIVVVNLSGHPYILSSNHIPIPSTVSNSFDDRNGVESALYTFPAVVADRRSCPLCSSLNKSRTASQAPPLGWWACELIL